MNDAPGVKIRSILLAKSTSITRCFCSQASFKQCSRFRAEYEKGGTLDHELYLDHEFYKHLPLRGFYATGRSLAWQALELADVDSAPVRPKPSDTLARMTVRSEAGGQSRRVGTCPRKRKLRY